MEAKENNYKSVVKSTIISFLSYTVLIAFIFILVTFFIGQSLISVPNLALSVVLSLICGILIFYIIHFICKSSTIESLKKEKMNEENAKKFIQKMNLFFVICVIFSVVFCLGYLFMNNFIYAKAIVQAHNQYDFISPELADRIENYIRIEYEENFSSKLFSTIIIELALVSSFLSLIPYQEKMLKKFNKK